MNHGQTMILIDFNKIGIAMMIFLLFINISGCGVDIISIEKFKKMSFDDQFNYLYTKVYAVEYFKFHQSEHAIYLVKHYGKRLIPKILKVLSSRDSSRNVEGFSTMIISIDVFYKIDMITKKRMTKLLKKKKNDIEKMYNMESHHLSLVISYLEDRIKGVKIVPIKPTIPKAPKTSSN